MRFRAQDPLIGSHNLFWYNPPTMFDPYHKWLAIPPGPRPPTYYQLLGVAPGEKDLDVIDEAALRQMAHVRAYQIGPHAAESQRLLNEISEARTVLLNAEKRKAYDEALAKPVAPVPSEAVSVRPLPSPATVRPVLVVDDALARGDDPVARKHGRERRARQSSGRLPLVLIFVGGVAVAVVAIVGVLFAGGVWFLRKDRPAPIVDAPAAIDKPPAIDKLPAIDKPPDGDPAAPRFLVNRNSGKVIGVFARAKIDGGMVVQWTMMREEPNQSWQVVRADGGWCYIVNANSGTLLSVDRDAHAGARLVIWRNKNDPPAQQWKLISVNQDDGGWFKIIHRASGKAVGIAGGSVQNGAAAVLADDVPANHLLWRFEK
jgi:hypothetical protein